MVSLLWLCHTGAVTCSDQEATAIREAAVMLGIHLNLEQQQTKGQEQREDMQRAFFSKKRKFIDMYEETKEPKKRQMMKSQTPEQVAKKTASKGSMANCTAEEKSSEATTSNYTPQTKIHLSKGSNGSWINSQELKDLDALPQFNEHEKCLETSMKKDNIPQDFKSKEKVDKALFRCCPTCKVKFSSAGLRNKMKYSSHIRKCGKSVVPELNNKISFKGKIQSVKCCPKCAKEYDVAGIEDAKKYRMHARWCGKQKVYEDKSGRTHNQGKKGYKKQCPICSKIYNVDRKKKLAIFKRHVQMCGKTKSKNIHAEKNEAEIITAQNLVCPKCEEEFDATGEENIETYRIHVWKCRKHKPHNIENTAKVIKQETNNDRCPSCQKMFHKSGLTRHMKSCGNKDLKVLSMTKLGNKDGFFEVAEKSNSKIMQVVTKECQNCMKKFKHEGIYLMHIKQCTIKSISEPGVSIKVGLPDKECPKCQRRYHYSSGSYGKHIKKCETKIESEPDTPDLKKVRRPETTQILSVKKEPEQIKRDDSISNSGSKEDNNMDLKSPCQICDMSFSKYSDLRNHYTTDHYWARLETQFSAWDRTCKFCHIKFSSSERLLLHTGNFHCARSIDTYLREEGYRPTSVEWTTKLLVDTCNLCGKKLKNPATLKSHLAMKHYGKELNREFPSSSKTQIKCWKCGRRYPSRSRLTEHLGGFHDEVLKYARKVITVGPDDLNIIPINGFEEEGEKVQLEDEDSKSVKQRKNCPIGQSSTISDGEGAVKRFETDEDDTKMCHKEEGDYEVFPKDETENNSDDGSKVEEMNIEIMNTKVQDNEREQTWRKPLASPVVTTVPFKESEHLLVENKPEPQTASATVIYSTLSKYTAPSEEPETESALESKCLLLLTTQGSSHQNSSTNQAEEETFSQESFTQPSPFHDFDAYKIPQPKPVHGLAHIPAAVMKPAPELALVTLTIPVTSNTPEKSAKSTPITPSTSIIPGPSTAPSLSDEYTSQDNNLCQTADELGLLPDTSTAVSILSASNITALPTTAATSNVHSAGTNEPSTEHTMSTKPASLSAPEEGSTPSILHEPSTGLESASSSAPKLDSAPSALPAPSSPDKLRKDMACAVKELLCLQNKDFVEHDEVQPKSVQHDMGVILKGVQKEEPEKDSNCKQQTEPKTLDQLQEVHSETVMIPECVQTEETDKNPQETHEAQPGESEHHSGDNIRAVFDNDSDSE